MHCRTTGDLSCRCTPITSANDGASCGFALFRSAAPKWPIQSIQALLSVLTPMGELITSRLPVIGSEPQQFRQADFNDASRSQHQLAAGVAQFELSVRFPHVVEGEDSGNRHFQLTPCDEVCQLGDHRCGCGISAAF